MKSKFKSLFFWAVFFFLLISLMFLGCFFSFPYISQSEHYADLFAIILSVTGYVFIAIYVVFLILIFANKFPKKIKKFERFGYLITMFILLLLEMMYVGSVMYDFD